MKCIDKSKSYIPWFIWGIVFFVYTFTAQKTVGFWDSGQLLASAQLLQVSEAPGYPLYILIARIFSLFSLGNIQYIPFCISLVSVCAASFTVFFVYKTTEIVARILISRITDISYNVSLLLIIASAGIASLSLAFSDSFWSIATQPGVYPLSVFVIILLVWCMLQWQIKGTINYIACIVFMLGLSMGVNNIVWFAVPGLVVMYYFKQNSDYSVFKMIGIIAGSICATALFIYLVVHGIPSIAFACDLVCVNMLNLPVNSGFVVLFILSISLGVLGIYYSYIYNKKILQSVSLASVLFIIAYSINAIIIIRSAAHVPINQNCPDNAYSSKEYFSRYLFSDKPLMYGNSYCAIPDSVTSGEKVYIYENNSYTHIYTEPKPLYYSQFMQFFPRMWSNIPFHIEEYKRWANIEEGINTKPLYVNGKSYNSPTLKQHCVFFLKYQLQHMYIRYFLWNFVGRQNDIQGNGEPHKGNWISGISFIDSMRLGDQDVLNDSLHSDSSRNTYFFIPLLLGFAGIIGLWLWNKKYALVFTLLFISTGIGVVLYLNQTPLQVRERDYIYVGSYLFYAICIGLGVISLFVWLRQYFVKHALYISIAIAVVCPSLLFAYNYNDHNRRNVDIAYQYSKNVLATCKPNAILFATSDNDIYPLWYLQMVEQKRTDVRVVNIHQLSKEWYIQELQNALFTSSPISFGLPIQKYRIGTNESLFVLVHSPLAHIYYPIKDIIQFIASDNSKYKAQLQHGELVDYIPVPNLVLPVNKLNALQAGIICNEDTSRVMLGIPFTPLQLHSDGTMQDSIISKSTLAMLDIIAHFEWKRPLYCMSNIDLSTILNLQNYMYSHGLASLFTPIESLPSVESENQIHIEEMYNNLMKTYSWGNASANQGSVNEYERLIIQQYRSLFAIAAQSCMQTKQFEKARNLVDACMQLFPQNVYNYDIFMIAIASIYYELGKVDMYESIVNALYSNIDNMLLYYRTVPKKFEKVLLHDVVQDVGFAIEMYQQALQIGDNKFSTKIAHMCTLFIEDYFSFTRQISVCLPQEFQVNNMWIMQLQSNLAYVAYWYNYMKYNVVQEQKQQL
jgi:hypothetical protein